MRENMGLYRGKRKDNGKFIEGFYIFDGFDHYIVKFCADENAEGTLYPVQESFEVIPETVGQYTCLPDKNGKKIFEGDVVKAERICNGKAWLGSVVWWNGCFAIQGIKDRNVPAIDLFVEYEVIGNIHDNRELLEVK